MAEEENPEGAGEEGKSRKGLFVGALVLVLALVGGGAAWWFLAGGSQSEAQATSKQESAPAPSPEANGSTGEMLKLKGFVVNLSRSDRARYLKTTIQLELSGKPALKKANKMKPQMRDALIILLSNQGMKDLSSMQGKYELKRQIVARLNNLLGRGTVRNAFFTEFVIQ